MELTEGSIASMIGTKFLLRESVGNNIVISDMSAPGDGEYIWAIGATNNTVWGSTYQSCELVYS